jgi:hypothetical protein
MGKRPEGPIRKTEEDEGMNWIQLEMKSNDELL